MDTVKRREGGVRDAQRDVTVSGRDTHPPTQVTRRRCGRDGDGTAARQQRDVTLNHLNVGQLG